MKADKMNKAKEYLNEIGICREQNLRLIDDRDITTFSAYVYQDFDLVQLMEDFAKQENANIDKLLDALRILEATGRPPCVKRCKEILNKNKDES